MGEMILITIAVLAVTMTNEAAGVPLWLTYYTFGSGFMFALVMQYCRMKKGE